MPSRARCEMAIAVALFLRMGVCESGAAEPQPARRMQNPGCVALAETGATAIEPATIRPANGRTVVYLRVQFGENSIGKDRIRHRSYNGALVGPVIRTRPGHTQYSPTPVDAKVGDTVRWTWFEDNHSVTSDTGLIDSGVQDKTDPPFDFVFNAAGTYPYHCTQHAGMKGVVNVTAGAGGASKY